jgi:hypothetical protein
MCGRLSDVMWICRCFSLNFCYETVDLHCLFLYIYIRIVLSVVLPELAK